MHSNSCNIIRSERTGLDEHSIATKSSKVTNTCRLDTQVYMANVLYLQARWTISMMCSEDYLGIKLCISTLIIHTCHWRLVDHFFLLYPTWEALKYTV